MARILFIGNGEEKLVELLKNAHEILVIQNITDSKQLLREKKPDFLLTKINFFTEENKILFKKIDQDIYLKETPLVVYTQRKMCHRIQKYLKKLKLNFQIALSQDEVATLINNYFSYREGNKTAPCLIAKNINRRIKSIEGLCFRLTQVIELNTKMMGQHECHKLIKIFFKGAKKILDAEFVVLGIIDQSNSKFLKIMTEPTYNLQQNIIVENKFRDYKKETLLHRENIKNNPGDFALPSDLIINSLIIVPLHSKRIDYGFVFFVNRNKQEKFSNDDLYLAQSLGLHYTLIHENFTLTSALENKAHDLEDEIDKSTYLQKQIETQYNIAKILAESPNLFSATPHILKTIGCSLNWEVGNLWAVDNDKNELKCVASWTKNEQKYKLFKNQSEQNSLKKNHSIPGKVWQEQQLIYSSDFVKQIDKYRYKPALEAGLKSVIAFPVIFKDEVLGVIEFMNQKPKAPNEETKKLLIAIGHQIATFIKRKRAEKELLYIVEHDPLTRLANRNLLVYFLNNALIRAKQQHNKIALLFLDLDNFKIINDTLGHAVGDKLLKKVASRIKSCLRSQDLFARVGGDEFVILLHNIIFSDSVAVVAQKILNILKEPFIIDEQECYVSVSIGISLYPNDGKDDETLLKNADLAMYKAKEAGRNNYQFCTNEMSRLVQAKMSMETKLRHAFNHQDEFKLFFDPILDINNDEIIAIESLLRWELPSGEMLTPIDFIHIAEETGLIGPISEWFLRQGCIYQRQMQEQYKIDLPMAIGVTATIFFKDNFINLIEAILVETKQTPTNIELEICESTLLKDMKKSLSILQSLKKTGIRISIDNVGLNVSIMNYLKAFEIDSIKIKSTCIQNITRDSNDLAMITNIISLAHELNIKVVAKGVDEAEQYALLKKYHCDQCQGPLFGGPVQFNQIKILLAKNWPMAA